MVSGGGELGALATRIVPTVSQAIPDEYVAAEARFDPLLAVGG